MRVRRAHLGTSISFSGTQEHGEFKCMILTRRATIADPTRGSFPANMMGPCALPVMGHGVSAWMAFSHPQVFSNVKRSTPLVAKVALQSPRFRSFTAPPETDAH